MYASQARLTAISVSIVKVSGCSDWFRDFLPGADECGAKGRIFGEGQTFSSGVALHFMFSSVVLVPDSSPICFVFSSVLAPTARRILASARRRCFARFRYAFFFWTLDANARISASCFSGNNPTAAFISSSSVFSDSHAASFRSLCARSLCASTLAATSPLSWISPHNVLSLFSTTANSAAAAFSCSANF